MKNNQVKICLSVEEFDGRSVEINTVANLYEDQGYDTIAVLGEKVNELLKSLGYPRFDKDTVLMQSMTVEEADYLYDCLEQFREEKKQEEFDKFLKDLDEGCDGGCGCGC